MNVEYLMAAILATTLEKLPAALHVQQHEDSCILSSWWQTLDDQKVEGSPKILLQISTTIRLNSV